MSEKEEPTQVGPNKQQTIQIIAIDNPRDIAAVKTLNGNVLSVPTVVRMMKAGRDFSVVDPQTHQITAVTFVDDNTIKTIGDETQGNNLKHLETFDP